MIQHLPPCPAPPRLLAAAHAGCYRSWCRNLCRLHGPPSALLRCYSRGGTYHVHDRCGVQPRNQLVRANGKQINGVSAWHDGEFSRSLFALFAPLPLPLTPLTLALCAARYSNRLLSIVRVAAARTLKQHGACQRLLAPHAHV